MNSDALESRSEIPLPLAMVQGQPYQDLPDDLYIPPDALTVFLEAFEGPLDLLLYLIRRQNLDILNIPIAQITKQYIAYIDMMDSLRLELAAEYLVMAALLAEIKSRMLLPRQPESEEEEEDPRAFLIRKLQEYEAIKKVAEEIDMLPRNERDTFEVTVDTSTVIVSQIQPDVELKELLLAFQDVLKRARQLSHHQITKEPLSVRERMAAILEKLNRTDQLPFAACFTGSEGKNGVVVAFLAILELSKERIVDIIQPEPYAAIYIGIRANADSGD
ncbi:segregation/condensation protein A [Methylomonas sp. SURF-2]|uniref:Segregation and condensation protein A n=1 Tax=Methylomonas subterranea TaxID=2952225 RepID=A0ABT1TJK0_9GAMM|nr:ScpA family protein [Methylomonas sp. SURF-2]MCQ8105242.1 segregation/condensation protein A [Methylomonas sp. SURF-2]